MSDDAPRNYQRFSSTVRFDSDVGIAVGVLLRYLLLQAVEKGATDIHIYGTRSESGDRYYIAKIRAGGMLTRVNGLDGEPLVIPQDVGDAAKDRVAQVAGFDLDKEARYPRSGKFEVEIPNGQRMDLRVEIIAVRDIGWFTVIRLLDVSSPEQTHVYAA